MSAIIIEVYPSRRLGVGRQQWRWRAKAGNHRIIANGGESFINIGDALDSVDALFRSSDVWLHEAGQDATLLRIAADQ